MRSERWRVLLNRPTARVLVARQGDAVRGAIAGAAIVLFHARRRHARLYSIATHPDARGLGVGAALLTASEAAARGRGASALRLEVRAENHAARALYQRAGYTEFARREGYYADAAPAICYEKPLADE